MKVPVHDIIVKCPKHGNVPYTVYSDFSGGEVTRDCPRCEAETRAIPVLAVSGAGNKPFCD